MRCTDKWDTMLRLLAKYKAKFGTCDVPDRPYADEPDGFEGLGRWVYLVRNHAKKFRNGIPSLMDEAKMKQLTEVGFSFHPIRGKKPTVPSVGPLRETKSHDKNWTEKWDTMIEELAKFREANGGDIQYPDNLADFDREYPGLRIWIATVRYYMRQYHNDPARCPFLNDEKIDLLTELGISLHTKAKDWRRTQDMDWDEMYAKLLKFYEEHENVKVPTSQVSLNTWLNRMRREYEKILVGEESNVLTEERIQKLQEVGFRLDKERRRTFDERVKEWLDYKKKHGKDPTPRFGGTVGRWLNNCRYKYKQMQNGETTTLTKEQIDRLTKLGFKWDGDYKYTAPARPSQPWEQSFQDLVAFKEQHGHVMVPRNHDRLGHWVHAQRNAYTKFLAGKHTHLTNSKIKKLTDLGFAFRTTRAVTRQFNQAMVSADGNPPSNNVPLEGTEHLQQQYGHQMPHDQVQHVQQLHVQHIQQQHIQPQHMQQQHIQQQHIYQQHAQQQQHQHAYNANEAKDEYAAVRFENSFY